MEATASHSVSREYVLRKLHSLSGLVPVGAFLLEHFYSNLKAYGPGGEQRFNQVVRDLQLNPFILPLEILLIALPLLFHGGYGLVIAAQGRPNNASQNYLRNWLYTLQRISGVVLFLYIGYHVYNTRLAPYLDPGNQLWQAEAGHKLVSFKYMQQYLMEVHFGVPVAALYIVGILAASFHFANGLWNMGLHWGLTVGPRAQRRSGVACALFGLLLFGIGLLALSAFADPLAALAAS